LAQSEVVLDPIVVVLATAAGALIGTTVGILLLRRKLRPPITDAEHAELKGKLQAGESSLAAASANLEDLRKQIAVQERALLQSGEDLKKKQDQLEAESVETQKERARRAAAEQSVQELSAQSVVLAEQCNKLEARAKEETELVAARANELVSAVAEMEAGKLKIQALTEQASRLTAEAAELKRFGEQEARFRAALEAQLNADQERIKQMTSQIADLQAERLQLEIKVREERGSAAKGMELLLMAQEKLSSVFKALNAEGQNGHHSPAPPEASAPPPDGKVVSEEIAQAATSSN
jgi:chromosome segregation ATPase